MRHVCTFLLVFCSLLIPHYTYSVNSNSILDGSQLKNIRNKLDNMYNSSTSELEEFEYEVQRQESLLQLHRKDIRHQLLLSRRQDLRQRKEDRRRIQCLEIKQRIKQLNKRFTQGYTRKVGHTLESKLERLKLQQQYYCDSRQSL